MDLGHLRERIRVGLEVFGVDIVDLRIDPSRRVRIWIDREPNPITLDDCAKLNRQLRHLLEDDGFDPDAIHLELQSPGLDRLLTRARDFERFAGEEVKLILKEKTGDRRTWTGTLVGLREGEIILKNGDQEQTFARRAVKEIRLIPNVPENFRRKDKTDKRSTSGRTRRPTKSRRKRKRGGGSR